MQLFGTDLYKTLWTHGVEMTSKRRRCVASTSLRRHVSAGNLASPCPPSPRAPPPPLPNFLNLFIKLCIKCNQIWFEQYMAMTKVFTSLISYSTKRRHKRGVQLRFCVRSFLQYIYTAGFILSEQNMLTKRQ